MIRKTSKKGGEEANLATRPAKGETNRPTKCSNKWRRTKKEHCIRIIKNLKVSTEEKEIGEFEEANRFARLLNSKKTLVRLLSPVHNDSRNFSNPN